MSVVTKKISMEDLLSNNELKVLEIGDVLEGVIVLAKKNEVMIDLGSNGFGIISKKEIGAIRNIPVGEKVTVSVVDPDIDNGQVLLSTRKATKDKGWDEIQRLFESQEIINITPYDANRGGLLVELEGIRGFLPVSQLSAVHYPRVSGADKEEILQKLNRLTKEVLKVRILDINRKDNKLIFSEREAVKEDMQNKFTDLKVGNEVDGVVTGVIDFGAFVNVDGIEGLIHISEISWERVDDPKNYLKVGDKIRAKIIAIDKDRLSLSLKQMVKDPWMEEIKAYKKGALVKGKVTRITPFGAFVQLSPSVEALVHVSEMSDDESIDPEKIFQLNEIKEFKVIDVDEDNRKIALSLKDAVIKKQNSKSKK
jgi:small subunit ribosomal protein S1